jgi:predicted lipid-binding transport protein (Tim44 family)
MMKHLFSIGALIIGLTLVASHADAARVGGGRSTGAQRSAATPSAQQPPARQAQPAAPAATPAAPAPAPASGWSRWAPMLGGLAIGGLLGSMFAGGGGLGGGLGSILMMALLGVAVVFLVRMFMSRQRTEPLPAGAQSMSYQSMGHETVAAPPPSQAAGFDAPMPTRGPNVPAGFDVTGFVRQAKLSYIRMQVANDAGKLEELREMSTPDMYAALKADVEQRAGQAQTTDVVTLEADLLEVVTEGNMHWASVRFSGFIREVPGQAPVSFEEVWNLSKPVDGSTGWLLAGIQQPH